MTKIQIKFFNLIKKQIIDYEEIFHKEFVIKRIEQIPEEKLRFLLENINVDKDNFTRNKSYTTYTKFIHYADKMISELLDALYDNEKPKEVVQKRNILLSKIEEEAPTIEKRNQLIKDIENKLLMFKDKNKNFLDDADYYIIEKIGFQRFFNENNNYKLKEEIEKYYREFIKSKSLVVVN